jgi:hypothetical protein
MMARLVPPRMNTAGSESKGIGASSGCRQHRHDTAAGSTSYRPPWSGGLIQTECPKRSFPAAFSRQTDGSDASAHALAKMHGALLLYAGDGFRTTDIIAAPARSVV